MTTQSNVCVCETCVGTQCTCGCSSTLLGASQNATPVPAASCQCGEVCSCGETCSCNGCQHPVAR